LVRCGGAFDLRRRVLDGQFDGVRQLGREDLALHDRHVDGDIRREVDGLLADQLGGQFDLLVRLVVHEDVALGVRVEVFHLLAVEVDLLERLVRTVAVADDLPGLGVAKLDLVAARALAFLDVLVAPADPDLVVVHHAHAAAEFDRSYAHAPASPVLGG